MRPQPDSYRPCPLYSLLVVTMVRFLLYIIFFFFVVLIVVEKAIIALISFCKNILFKLRRRLTAIGIMIKRKISRIISRVKLRSAHTKENKQALLRIKKKSTAKKKLSSPFRTKVKYFFFGILFSSFFIFLPIFFLVFLQDLPSPRELTFRQIPQTSKIYDRNDILLAEIYTTHNRTLIPLSDVPKHLQNATLAIEDKNFYSHPGFDILSILRAFGADYAHGRVIQGGSTITQQLIKSSILTSEQSIVRKIKEVALAFWAERIYTKQQILEMYFNQVPYGGTAWGVEAASETYFSKPVKELSLAESAFLAGLTSAPSTYSPYGLNPNLWKKRQKEVLNRMVALRYISQAQAEEAQKQTLNFRRQQGAIHAPHFVAYIKDLLINKYGIAMVEKGGLQVKTTLDLKTQELAEKIVKEEVDNASYLNLTNGAAVVTDPRNGDIIAMVGSRDFDDPNGGNVNLATSLRQPGSSIKVVTYSTALSSGFTAASIIDDSPISFPSESGAYAPVNYDGRYRGKVTLRFALANSLNIPAVKILDKVGVPTMAYKAKSMGVESWGNANNYGLSLTLGAAEVTMLDMARVNGVLANGGVLVDINPIAKITDSKRTVLEEKVGEEGIRTLDQGVAFILSDILADNNARSSAFGPNSPLNIPKHRVSVKTGTSDEKRDNWTNGYTNNYVVVVWVGNNDNTPMSPTLASGITGAAPIWNRIMTNLLEKNPEAKATPPENVIQKTCQGRKEYFVKGTEEGCR